jgi:hypothetical protein
LRPKGKEKSAEICQDLKINDFLALFAYPGLIKKAEPK